LEPKTKKTALELFKTEQQVLIVNALKLLKYSCCPCLISFSNQNCSYARVGGDGLPADFHSIVWY